jgi:hypothetical protein
LGKTLHLSTHRIADIVSSFDLWKIICLRKGIVDFFDEKLSKFSG